MEMKEHYRCLPSVHLMHKASTLINLLTSQEQGMEAPK